MPNGLLQTVDSLTDVLLETAIDGCLSEPSPALPGLPLPVAACLVKLSADPYLVGFSHCPGLETQHEPSSSSTPVGISTQPLVNVCACILVDLGWKDQISYSCEAHLQFLNDFREV